MKKPVSTIVGMSALLFGFNALGADCNNIVGDWENQLGSTLTIASVSPTGQIQGTYVSPSGTSGSTFPLIGWENEVSAQPNMDNAKVVSFSVNWGTYGSVTSWSGTCSDSSGTPTISTVWNLVRSNSQFVWDHVLTNSDIFTPK